MEVQVKAEQPKVMSRHLSMQEEQVMKKRLRLLEDMRDDVEIMQGVNYEAKDPAKLDAEIARLKQSLSTKSVQAATGAERDSVLREISSLEEDLKKGMPKWDIYANTRRRDGMAYVKLKNQIMKWESDPERKRKVARWKYLRRRLDPSDPDIANTMHLFPE
jgi:hypothetical protein